MEVSSAKPEVVRSSLSTGAGGKAFIEQMGKQSKEMI